MGNFRIEIEAVGGHGDARDVGDGGKLDFSSYNPKSLDKVAYEAVNELRARGATIVSAKLIHWPGEKGEVTDDVLKQTRTGAF